MEKLLILKLLLENWRNGLQTTVAQNVLDEKNILAQILVRMSDLPEFVGLSPITTTTKGNFGNTPLHVAAVWGDAQAIHLLVKNGANIDAHGEYGYTPLHEAVEQRQMAAIETLISLGASLDSRNSDGQNAQDLASLIEWDDGIKFFKKIARRAE